MIRFVIVAALVLSPAVLAKDAAKEPCPDADARTSARDQARRAADEARAEAQRARDEARAESNRARAEARVEANRARAEARAEARRARSEARSNSAVFQFDVPDLPDIEIPEIDIPEIDVKVPDFHMLATHSRHDQKASDEDEEDRDSDDDDNDNQADTDDRGVKVYKMNKQRTIHIPRIHVGGDEGDDWDERDSTAQAKGKGSATMQVKGPVTFQLRAQSGDIEIVTTDRQQISVSVSDAPPEEVALYAFGDRVEPAFRGRRTLRRGKLHVELPRGSRVDLSSMSGDVTAQRVGDVRIRTMSGDVKLAGVGKADVQTISGDVRIDDASGAVRLHTVSGHGIVNTSNPSPQVEFQSASGNMDWSGVCGKDCHLSAETVSGELQLALDPRSSFELSYTSHSGELRDELNLAVKRAPRHKHGMASGWLEASFGKGEGVIEADAFSGNLTLKKK